MSSMKMDMSNMEKQVIATFDPQKIKYKNLEEYKRSKVYENLKEYDTAGVWALWGENKEGKDTCLEVGQTNNVYKEIKSALYILFKEDDLKCKQCTDIYYGRQRYKEYSVKFKIHKCRLCKHVSNLRIKSRKKNPRYIDKYKDIILNYRNLEFRLVSSATDMQKRNKRCEREREYAEEQKALYWCG